MPTWHQLKRAGCVILYQRSSSPSHWKPHGILVVKLISVRIYNQNERLTSNIWRQPLIYMLEFSCHRCLVRADQRGGKECHGACRTSNRVQVRVRAFSHTASSEYLLSVVLLQSFKLELWVLKRFLGMFKRELSANGGDSTHSNVFISNNSRRFTCLALVWRLNTKLESNGYPPMGSLKQDLADGVRLIQLMVSKPLIKYTSAHYLFYDRRRSWVIFMRIVLAIILT